MIYPAIQPTSGNKFILLEEYRYDEVIIPKGTETNGADIPRVFWSIIPPFKPKYLPAVLIHDYLIKIANNKKEITCANDYFEKILLEIEDSYKTRIMIIAVKIYWKLKIK